MWTVEPKRSQVCSFAGLRKNLPLHSMGQQNSVASLDGGVDVINHLIRITLHRDFEYIKGDDDSVL